MWIKVFFMIRVEVRDMVRFVLGLRVGKKVSFRARVGDSLGARVRVKGKSWG